MSDGAGGEPSNERGKAMGATSLFSHRTRAWRKYVEMEASGGGETEELCDAQRNSDTGKMRVRPEVRGTATKGRSKRKQR